MYYRSTFQLVLSSTLTLPNSTFGYIHTVFVWWAASSICWTFKHCLCLVNVSSSIWLIIRAFGQHCRHPCDNWPLPNSPPRLAYSHTFWNPLIYYSMNAKVLQKKRWWEITNCIIFFYFQVRQKCQTLAASLPILRWETINPSSETQEIWFSNRILKFN